MVILEVMGFIFCLFVGSLFLNDDFMEKKHRLALQVGLLFLAVLPWLANCYAIVPQGHEGVKLSFGKANDIPTEQGMQILFPWQDVIPISLKDDFFELDTQCFTSDLQEIHIPVKVTARRIKGKSAEIFKLTESETVQRLMIPKTLEIIKAESARHQALETISNYPAIQSVVETDLAKDMLTYHYHVTTASLSAPRFSAGYQKAVDSKQNASIKVGEAKNDLDKYRTTVQNQIEMARGKANDLIAEAIGKAESLKKQADGEAYQIRRRALGEYKASVAKVDAKITTITRVRKALDENPGVISFEIVEAWKGNAPTSLIDTTKSDGDAMNLLILPSKTTK